MICRLVAQIGQKWGIKKITSRSSSSASSTTSLTERHQHIDILNPVASTSKSSKTRNNKELHLEEINPNRQTIGRSSSSINLNEAIAQTNVPFAESNPSRDGFYARVNKVLVKHASAAVVGAAVGLGVVVNNS